MKKLLGIILTVALVFTMASVLPAFAFDEVFNLDFVEAYVDYESETPVATLAGGSAVLDFGDDTPAKFMPLVGPAVQKGATLFYVVAWYMPSKELADIGYSVDGGEAVYDEFAIYQAALCDAIKGMGAGWENGDFALRIQLVAPILEGRHEMKLVAKFADGTSKPIYIFNYDTNNVAYQKTVHEELNGGASMGSGFWTPEYANDGLAPIFDGVNTVPLGWYIASPGTACSTNLVIDLGNIYDVYSVGIVPMGWMNGIMFPGSYKITVSEDGENWSEVYSASGRSGAQTEPVICDFTSVNARYVSFGITGHSGDVMGDGYGYSGFGEIEVFGTFVDDAVGTGIYENYYKNYTGNLVDSIGSPTAWTGHNTKTLTYSFVFNTDVAFKSLGFPKFWAYPGCPLKIEFKNGDTVTTVEKTLAGDGAIKIDLDTALPAGEYVVTMTITDDASVTTESGETYVNYFVIGFPNQPDGPEYVATERNTVIALNLYSDDDSGKGFIPREFKYSVNTDIVGKGDTSYGVAEGTNVPTEEGDESVKYVGWMAANYPVEKYGYKLDGGETVYNDAWRSEEGPITEAALALFPVAGNGFRAKVDVPVVDDGYHEVEIVGFSDGEERHMITFSYGTKPEKEYVDYNAGESTDSPLDGKAIWMNNAGEYASATFTTSGSFNKITLTKFWASRLDNKVPVTVRMFLEDENGLVVGADEIQAISDGNPDMVLDLEGDVPAGTYTFTVEVTGQYLNGTNNGAYLVLDHAPESKVDNIEYRVNAKNPGNGTFAFIVTGEKVDGDFFVSRGEPNPGTGNTAALVFASVAALAFAAAVVLKKKRSF